MAERVNLVKNPSFESSIIDWSATGASVTIASYASDGYSGTSSLQVTKKATTDCGAVVASRIQVTADLKYTVSAYVKVPSGEEASAVRVNVEWYTAEVSGSYIYMNSSTALAISDSLGWTRIHGTFRAPATAVAAVISVTQPAAGTADETFLIDAVLFEQADKLNTYIGPTERVNIVANPSFETDTTGWAGAQGATIARITTDFFIGDSCLEVTKSNTSLTGTLSSDSSRISVTPSTEYAVSAYVKIPDGQETGSLFVSMSWYTALTGGSLLSSPNGTSVSVADGDGWVRVGDIFTSPAGAYGLRVSVRQSPAGTAGKKFLVDAIMVEQTDYIRNYIDEPSQARETKAVTDGFRPVPQPVITGMKLQADISLGNLVLNTVDENNVVWVCTDINGWWTIPDPEIQDIPRGFSDGSYIARGRYAARQLELTGSFFTPDSSYVPAARDRLIEAINLVYGGNWLVVNEEIPKAAFVRLSGRPEISTTTARGRTDFSVGLTAGDPIKYEWNAADENGYSSVTFNCKSASPAYTGKYTITNLGNIATPALFYVNGPIAASSGTTANATVTNNATGDQIKIIHSVDSGDILEIDTYNRSVILNDSGTETSTGIRAYLDTLVDWIYLQPGDNEIEFIDNNAANSTATITVYYRSGWIG
jgi:hypothetical protein